MGVEVLTEGKDRSSCEVFILTEKNTAGRKSCNEEILSVSHWKKCDPQGILEHSVYVCVIKFSKCGFSFRLIVICLSIRVSVLIMRELLMSTWLIEKCLLFLFLLILFS